MEMLEDHLIKMEMLEDHLIKMEMLEDHLIKKLDILPIRIVKWLTFRALALRHREIMMSSTMCFMFLSDEGPTLETLYFTIRIGSTPSFFIFRFVPKHYPMPSTLRLFHIKFAVS